MKTIYKIVSPFVLLAVLATGCKKDFLETSPTDAVASEDVFKTTEGAYVALNGIYRSMYNGIESATFGQKAVDLTLDYMGNDMVKHSSGYGWFNAEYNYTAGADLRTDQRRRPYATWDYYYKIINNANLILANVDAASGPEADKKNLKGQALALRANSYFYLINLFQQTYKGNESKPGVPLYTAPTREGKARGTVQEVYSQIIADLTEAEQLLTGVTRIHISHINLKTVQGIRARVALQMEDYATAAAYAHKAKEGVSLMTKSDYAAGFSRQNSEWIWGLKEQNDQSGIYASFWSHVDPYADGYAALGGQIKITKQLYDQIADGDIRKTVFVTPGTGEGLTPDYTSLKFLKPVEGSWEADDILMRAGEMYLIEAEALARTGDDAGARTLLNNLVQSRYTGYSATQSGSALISEILKQRRIELWGEGFALLDITRLKQGLSRPSGDGNHTVALARTLTLPAGDPKFIFKIPQAEFDANKALTTSDQNP